MTGSASRSTIRLPEVGAGFRWESGAQTVALFARTTVADAAFTTRLGGLCPAPYDSLNVGYSVGDQTDPRWNAAVAGNRRIAGSLVGGDGEWRCVRQVHGGDVVEASRAGPAAEADAIWTDSPDHTIAVSVADCVPVLLASDEAIVCAHAGWRGMLAGVLENAAAAIGAHSAWVGPSIGPCCFEVGAGVARRFDTSAAHVDLWTYAAGALARAGVGRVWVAGVCSSCNPDLLFSHRRDHGRTGRQALVARLK